MSWCSDAPEDEAISLFAGLLANPDMTLNPPFLLLDLPFNTVKGFSKKKKISGEVNRDKTDRRSLVSSRWTQ